MPASHPDHHPEQCHVHRGPCVFPVPRPNQRRIVGQCPQHGRGGLPWHRQRIHGLLSGGHGRLRHADLVGAPGLPRGATAVHQRRASGHRQHRDRLRPCLHGIRPACPHLRGDFRGIARWPGFGHGREDLGNAHRQGLLHRHDHRCQRLPTRRHAGVLDRHPQPFPDHRRRQWQRCRCRSLPSQFHRIPHRDPEPGLRLHRLVGRCLRD